MQREFLALTIFLKVNTPWFRGVELRYGPRGCVYLTDWSDNGECHDHDGVHRTSGRIYRIAYGAPRAAETPPLVNANDDTLAEFSIKGNQWVARRARRILHEKAEHGHVALSVQTRLRNKLFFRPDGVNRLAVLQTLDLCGFIPHQAGRARTIEPWTEMDRILLVPDSGVRELAIRIMARKHSESPRGHEYCFTSLRSLAEKSKSPFILREIASEAHRLDPRHRKMIAEALAYNIGSHRDLADPALERMTWYLAEPSVADSAPQSFSMLPLCGTPRLVRFAIRKQIALGVQSPTILGSEETESDDFELHIAALQGILEGYEGVPKPKPFGDWLYYQGVFSNSKNEEVRDLTRDVAALFGDVDATAALRRLAAERSSYATPRIRAIMALSASRDVASLPIFLSLLNDQAVYADVCAALASYDDPRIPKELLKRWNSLRHGSRDAATDTMVSRRSYAVALTGAIDDGRVDAADLTATHVRQLLSFDEPTITRIIEARWGVINDSSEAKAVAISSWKGKLMPEVLSAANIENGAALFKKTCANCHRLYGEGGKIGPDLTGGNRANMDYLLGNVIDPSAVVPRQWTTSVIALTSGRVITGVVVAETAQTIRVQTDKELMAIAVSDIDERTRTNKSLMPDGLMDPLTEAQVRDLIAFVRKRR